MADVQHPGEYEMAAALNCALADGDTCELMDTLARMVRDHRMRQVARETGLGKKSLYKSR